MNTEKERLQTLKDLFKEGEKLTLVEISSGMAMCYRYEIIVTQIKDENTIIFKHRGKRKEYIFTFERKAYTYAPIKIYSGGVFQGHNVQFLLDTDKHAPRKNTGTGLTSRQMRGNACYNFLGKVEEVKNTIETLQLNPFFEKDKVLAIDEQGEEHLVYSELYKGGHAVIDRIIGSN